MAKKDSRKPTGSAEPTETAKSGKGTKPAGAGAAKTAKGTEGAEGIKSPKGAGTTKSPKTPKGEKAGKPAKAEKSAGTAKAAKAEKPQKPGKASPAGKPAKAPKAGKAAKAGKADEPAAPEEAAKGEKKAEPGAAGATATATGGRPKSKPLSLRELLRISAENSKGSKGSARKAGGHGHGHGYDAPLSPLLRVPSGERVDLGAFHPGGTPAGPTDKAAGVAATAQMGERLASLQERLYAASTAGDRRRVLLVLQGMDTSGKGGTVKHVIGLFNPSGCRIKAFKAPTSEEQNHPFLWRIMKALPQAGEIGIFDRSHYEDVLIARVRDLVPRSQLGRRYAQINRFEKSLADDGVTVVKVFLHIGYEEQRKRLLERLDNPDKHWKFNAGDIEERSMWPAYQQAYELALERCSTDAAPWYVVPSDRKWYRNWAISKLLLEHLEGIAPQYPKGDFDVEECRTRLIST